MRVYCTIGGAQKKAKGLDCDILVIDIVYVFHSVALVLIPHNVTPFIFGHTFFIFEKYILQTNPRIVP